MTPVNIPKPLQDLLSDSSARVPTIELAEAVGTVLADNAMPFFPAYTDHGTQHVQRVLNAIVRLIPEEVWNAENLLKPDDAAVLICASLLHDLAMHVRESGFVELTSEGSRYKPHPWFSKNNTGRPADKPWPDLWSEFQREARHFGTSQIELLFGYEASGVPAVAYEDELDPDTWTQADRLLVGEFLRRHHARLSHEIAQYGLPGTTPEDFPVLGKKHVQLADVIGATSRSHNESLRCMLEYVDYLHKGSVRPAGVLLVFHMGLLRVADYLQIEADRAPPLLLRMKAPVSPLSIAEWNKHGAISSISWEHPDTAAIDITVSPEHGLRTHLALDQLFTDMQRELDVTSAVLSEVYSTKELTPLRLSHYRVRTNLDEQSLHDQLSYLPRRAALQSDPDLFRLVIRDLYGNQPAVAGREMIQNAVDAVRARRAMERHRGESVPDDRLRELEADVAVTLDEQDTGRCVLRVADRGIGMAPDLVVDYYLKAGASFGPTAGEIKDLGRQEAVAAMKAGRFGVGAFAAFLLGPEIEVITRHADQERGISFKARIDEDLVQLDWVDDVPVGTEVTVSFDGMEFSDEGHTLRPGIGRGGYFFRTIAEFYRLSDPSITFVHHFKGTHTLSAPADVPVPKRKLPDSWRRVRSSGMDAVIWQASGNMYRASGFATSDGGAVIHNGILIHEPTDRIGRDQSAFSWSDSALREFLRRPNVAVFDSRHSLGVALHRYSLVDRTLPFEQQLLDSIGADLVAHALVMGPRNHLLQDQRNASPVFARNSWMPLLPSLLGRYARGPLLVLWGFDRSPDLAPVLQPEPEEFTAAKGPLPWRNFPHRASIVTRAGGFNETDRSERQRWGFTLKAVRTAAKSWRGLLGASEEATVVVRGDAAEIGGVMETAYGAEMRSGATEPGLFLIENERSEADSVDGRQPEFKRDLVDAARALHAASPGQSIALSAFSGFSMNNPAFEQLSSNWVQAIDGGLERGPHKRHAAAEEILAENSELQPLAAKWRRTLQTWERRRRT